MSKARHQSQMRLLVRGHKDDMPNSTKLTKSARSLPTTFRTKKYSNNLTN